jgi:hypothetical protein
MRDSDNMHTDAYLRLRDYADDLTARLQQQEQWHLRHPDYPNRDSLWDAPDELLDADPYPQTGDIITAALFADLIVTAVTAYEQARRD